MTWTDHIAILLSKIYFINEITTVHFSRKYTTNDLHMPR